MAGGDQLQRGGIQRGIQRVGDHHVLRRDGAGVLEAHRVAQPALHRRQVVLSIAHGHHGLVVGVVGAFQHRVVHPRTGEGGRATLMGVHGDRVVHRLAQVARVGHQHLQGDLPVVRGAHAAEAPGLHAAAVGGRRGLGPHEGAAIVQVQGDLQILHLVARVVYRDPIGDRHAATRRRVGQLRVQVVFDARGLQAEVVVVRPVVGRSQRHRTRGGRGVLPPGHRGKFHRVYAGRGLEPVHPAVVGEGAAHPGQVHAHVVQAVVGAVECAVAIEVVEHAAGDQVAGAVHVVVAHHALLRPRGAEDLQVAVAVQVAAAEEERVVHHRPHHLRGAERSQAVEVLVPGDQVVGVGAHHHVAVAVAVQVGRVDRARKGCAADRSGRIVARSVEVVALPLRRAAQQAHRGQVGRPVAVQVGVPPAAGAVQGYRRGESAHAIGVLRPEGLIGIGGPRQVQVAVLIEVDRLQGRHVIGIRHEAHRGELPHAALVLHPVQRVVGHRRHHVQVAIAIEVAAGDPLGRDRHGHRHRRAEAESAQVAVPAHPAVQVQRAEQVRVAVAIHVGGMAHVVVGAYRQGRAQRALAVGVHHQHQARARGQHHVVVLVVVHVQHLHRRGAFHRNGGLRAVLGVKHERGEQRTGERRDRGTGRGNAHEGSEELGAPTAM